MKIRIVTLGVALVTEDFSAAPGGSDLPVYAKVKTAAEALKNVRKSLEQAGYEVKGVKIALNSFEEWTYIDNEQRIIEVLTILDTALEANDILSCSIGNCSKLSSLDIVPKVLALSSRFCCSFQILEAGKSLPPEYAVCHAVAGAIMEVSRNTASCVSNSFSFCGAFNVSSDSPMGPAAFHDSNRASTISFGLENADLLFLAFYAAENNGDASRNLQTCLRQTIEPLQAIAMLACEANNVLYGGIDISINPGTTPQDSVVAGIEFLKPNHFGSDGTMSALAVVSAALETVTRDGIIKTCGYSGICLPVLIDKQLAKRAAESPPSFSIRDLITYAAVSGVGLDAVPIAGDSSLDSVASLLMDLGSLSYKLNKPMICRVFPIHGVCAGAETVFNTDQYSPTEFVTNTTVFHL